MIAQGEGFLRNVCVGTKATPLFCCVIVQLNKAFDRPSVKSI
jgi:hypothetical protein